MNILVIGSGGREHTLAWKIRQSPRCSQLFVAPGNAGTQAIATNLAIEATDFPALATTIVEHAIELVIVGPEAPLVAGIREYFSSQPQLKDVLLVGPGKAGAMLEGSKDFSKDFMVRHGIPTAKARTFTKESLQDGKDFLNLLPTPIVLKADGLAAGKGVIIAQSHAEAQEALEEMLVQQKFGAASDKVLIEEFLDGIELSVFILTDGTNYCLLPEAKDYKRIGEGDTGPNTGGMGAVSPVHFADAAFMDKVRERIILPTLNGLKKDGIAYQGFLFIGLMAVKGEPMVIEYNVRMGDPETQAVIPRIESDFTELLIAAADGSLGSKTLKIVDEVAATVVLVAGGYPDSYQKGAVISGLPSEQKAAPLVFHAGTQSNGSAVSTNGGRVLAVTGLAASLENALQQAYDGISHIRWENMNYRRDIGQDLLQ